MTFPIKATTTSGLKPDKEPLESPGVCVVNDILQERRKTFLVFEDKKPPEGEPSEGLEDDGQRDLRRPWP
jgi:hypothetical protein